MKKRIVLVSFLLAVTVLYAWAGVKPSAPDAAQLQLMLKKLTVVGGALYVGAHPDDENTALLAYWSQGRLVRSAYLSLTRGEGGQNLIGSEQGAMLGLIRTQELLAAREVDHAQQFFTRAVDFGYSKSSDESLKMWGKGNVLSDVVWVIRKFRPDVIVCRFPTDGRGGHGHHTASAILAQEAFTAAGDPAQFPEQLKYVAPWKPKRILWNYFNWTGPPPEKDAASMVKTDIGGYSPVLGLSYTELAGMSRSMHKSQGFGDSEDRGPALNYFQPVAGEPAVADLFDGIDLTWKRIPESEKIAAALEEANRKFRPEDPAASLPSLLRAYDLMKSFPSNVWVEEKKNDVLQAIAACAGLWLEAIASDDSATSGSEIKVTATAINRSGAALRLESVQVVSMDGADAKEVAAPVDLSVNQPVSRELAYKIPEQMPVSQPYWIKENSLFRIDDVTDQRLIGLPESEPGIRARFVLSQGTEKLVFTVPVLFRRVDPVRGELYRHFEIIPDVALNLNDRVTVFAGTEPKKIEVTLTSGAPHVSGEVKIKVPYAWKMDPLSVPFEFSAKGQTRTVAFTVVPTLDSRSGILTVEAVVGSKHFSGGMVTIDYPHIAAQTAFPPAEGKLVKLDLKKAGENIAYIMGSGDAVPDALRQIGYTVTLLSAEDLAGGDLSHFDAIVVGIRAYNTRPELKAAQPGLLEYVKQGGTMVVQYNTLQELDQNGLGPYPLRISHDRVSVEDAPVTILAPDHQLLSFPNKITQDDFAGWIQERGLYFPDQWDLHYETILACNDPGETAKASGILFAKYGKGVYIYTGYSWFRELPAGVPGAFRLFVNLISAHQ
jgi:LmbE family N-acetylglucosaminyl deacetylase